MKTLKRHSHSSLTYTCRVIQWKWLFCLHLKSPKCRHCMKCFPWIGELKGKSFLSSMAPVNVFDHKCYSWQSRRWFLMSRRTIFGGRSRSSTHVPRDLIAEDVIVSIQGGHDLKISFGNHQERSQECLNEGESHFQQKKCENRIDGFSVTSKLIFRTSEGNFQLFALHLLDIKLTLSTSEMHTNQLPWGHPVRYLWQQD